MTLKMLKIDFRIILPLLGGALVLAFAFPGVSANYVFSVEHKFKGKSRSLSALRAHDTHRHGRILSASAVDMQLGGNGLPSSAGLYFTKIGIGSPSKNYHVQLDTGSDILWVNCAGCEKCPKKSNLGIKLSLYDPKGSSTSKVVTCDQESCSSMHNGRLANCNKPELQCQYNVVYGDGSSTSGHFVNDIVHLDKVTGNHQTSSLDGNVTFGCGFKQAGDEAGSSSEAVDGILGFGQANSSMLSQLALAGKVKKIFSHCLDNSKGGGVFAIGNVVHPQVTTTPIASNQSHYNVMMKHIEVDSDVLELPATGLLESITGSRSLATTIIDSGTTLAYLPEPLLTSFITKILARQPGLKLHTIDETFSCFHYSGKIDDGFPVVKFLFQNSLNLTVYPHDYIFNLKSNKWCLGWQKSEIKSKDGNEVTLLGDLVLSNKLVLYDLENQAIGWTEHTCSEGIKVKDEAGAEYTVGFHNISISSSLMVRNFFTFLLLVITMLQGY